MRFINCAILAAAAAWLGGCGPSNSKPSTETDASTAGGGNGGNNSTNAGAGTLWVQGYLSVKGVDIATGQVKVQTSLLTGGAPDINSLYTDSKHVWGGLSDGSLLVIDKSSGSYSTIPIDTGHTSGIGELAILNGTVYVGSGAEPDAADPQAPPVVQIDATTLQEKRRDNVFGTDFNQYFSRVLADGTSLWILAASGYALEQVNAQTMAVEDTIFLGENPNNPTGPRQDGYGYGDMAMVGNTIWVIDASSDRLPLLKVDKGTGAVTYVRALVDEFGAAAAGSCALMAANQDSFFISFCDLTPVKVARFDGQTGSTLKTYDIGSSIGPHGVKGQKLYTGSPTSDRQVIEIDVTSGAQRVVYTDSGLIGPLTVE